MLYLFHGSDHVSLRNELKSLSGNYSSCQNLDLNESTNQTIASAYYSNDFFSSTKLFQAEITNQTKIDFEGLGSLLQQTSQNGLLFYAYKKLEKSNPVFKFLPKTLKVSEFTKTKEVTIFNFLDLMLSANKKETYLALQALSEDKEEVFSVFAMVIYSLRNFALLAFESSSFDKLHPFVKSKIRERSKRFTKKFITEMYALLYETDKMAKVGKINSDMILPFIIEKFA